MAEWLHRKSQRSKCPGNEHIGPGSVSSQRDACRIQRRELVGQPKALQLDSIGSEGVGLDDIDPSLGVGPVNAGDEIGLGDVQFIE